ncbi:hypothetical protein THOM_3200 [Trachipleistophora hominis]|uniref:Uncharacterized protein n=1 Tax=Trachipleistophora hominis TaxID=72359 RepID=L7JQY5_TRAHO|nr:hypothetical protein THOM_3200 [Trachipleistophora hominis]
MVLRNKRYLELEMMVDSYDVIEFKITILWRFEYYCTSKTL